VAELGAERFDCRRVDIVEELDRAVAMGVLNASAIAIEGVLAFPVTPGRLQLKRRLVSALERLPEEAISP